ncbi:MAG TPA: cytochrome c oxidase subunit 3 [Candidatus Binatia bacterium]|nr:cytochrome c oxidase subunit 3 [Candidatus Binatia bacterium]
MATTNVKTDHSRYFVPDPSWYPFALTVGLFTLIWGVWSYLEDKHLGIAPVLIGIAIAVFIIVRWFNAIIGESEGGAYSAQVDRTFRWGMSWFIFSEVMFFGAFFGALFYSRGLTVPWLAGEGAKLATHLTLWPGFEAHWPTNGPANVGGEFETIPEWGVPFLNTILLVTSSFTVTWAHHALKEGQRRRCIGWMFVTVLLGATFLYFQAGEYHHAYTELNLTLGSGIYGSTFFMLTGFHGMHVTLGTLMLIVITGRLMAGHFRPDHHFGFEGVAWYWHFVDVVWIGLFTFVYVI